MSVREILLVGRPNSGKSTLYNSLVGGTARVGNFPGITVDVLEATTETKTGTLHVVDLPGVYALGIDADPASDEGQTRKFLDDAKGRDVEIVQVLDAMQLALGLRLTKDLALRKKPFRIVLTHADVLASHGLTIDVDALAKELAVEVLSVNARGHDAKVAMLAFLEKPATTVALEDLAPDALAKRVLADRKDATAKERARRERTARADRWLLHPVLGPILFLSIMATLFAIVFLVADPATNAMNAIVAWLSTRISAALGDGLLASLLCDGVLGGAGTVLAFLPQIVILTIALELIDASGYLSRGAFLVDRILRLANMGGRSFVPLLTAHACAVPAISATRIIRDPRQRLRTLLVIPLMTCSARIPTYSLLIATFFEHRGAYFRAIVFMGLYFAGIVAGLIASFILGRSKRAPRSLPLVLEMPTYQMPQASVILATAWRTCRRFVRDVGTVIVVASIALWMLLTIPSPFGSHASDGSRMQNSIGATIGHSIEPITKPAGFDWRIDVGLMGSFGARELMVSTLGVIFGIENTGSDQAPLATRVREAKNPDGSPAYSVATALALMAFFVIACQCMSTLAALRRETRSWKVPAFVLVYTYAIAYALAVVVFQIARALGA